MGMVKELGVGKSTIYFKINLIKILDKHTKLNKSSLSLNFFKDYAKTTKEICKESGSQFKKSMFSMIFSFRKSSVYNLRENIAIKFVRISKKSFL